MVSVGHCPQNHYKPDRNSISISRHAEKEQNLNHGNGKTKSSVENSILNAGKFPRSFKMMGTYIGGQDDAR